MDDTDSGPSLNDSTGRGSASQDTVSGPADHSASTVTVSGPALNQRREWSARTAYSANRLSNCKQYICQGVESGLLRGVTLHGDEIAKTPMFINFCDRGRGGYMMLDENGEAVIENDTHNFPLAESFTISTSGIVKCTRPSGGDKRCPARTFRPTRTEVFIRPVWYNPSSTLGVMHDLLQFVDNDAETQQADLLLYVSDNGGTYGANKAFFQFAFGRLFRQRGYAALCAAAYSAGDSRFNYEIESGWSQPR